MTETAPVTSTGTTGAAGATAVQAPDEPPEPSIGQLVASATRDVSALIRSEIALAKSEMKVSVKLGGVGLALLAAAGFIVVLAIIMLSVAIAYFISMTGLHLAWSFLLVFVLYAAVAALLGLVGVKKLKRVGPPERAIHQAQETKAVLSHRS